MGDSIKSLNSDVEEEEEDAPPLEVNTENPETQAPGASQLNTKEFRNYISNQLEKQLEASIAKALQTALEQIHQNEDQNELEGHKNRKHRYYQPNHANRESSAAPDFSHNQHQPGHKSRRVRINSSAHTMQIQHTSDEDGEPADTDGSQQGDKPCPSAAEPIALTLILVQVSLIVLFAFFVKYDDDVTANPIAVDGEGHNRTRVNVSDFHYKQPNSVVQYYSQYQDIQVMLFFGIGVLMAFLRKYGYSAIGFTMLAGALSIQWSILVRGIVNHRGAMIPLNIVSLIYGDFAAAVVLITFGVVIGVASPLQIIFMTFAEVIFYVLNEYIGAVIFQAVDTGGSIFVHIFAAYFGLGVSRAMGSAKHINAKHNASSYTSNIFALIAVVFLWLFWPSFNSVLSTGNDQHRVVVNTLLSLFGSCIFAFATSAMFNRNKFIISHIQNASLAGGVAVGAVVDLMIRPFGALTIGSLGGILCVFGCQYLSPLLARKIGLHDTCGVHNLHGLPGLLAAIAGVVMAAVAAECDYGQSLYLRYPARAPLADSPKLLELQQMNPDIVPGLDRSASDQAVYQLAALGVTLLIAIVGGAMTGFLMRIPIFGKVKSVLHFDDKAYFEVDDEEPQLTRRVQKHSTKVNGVGVTNTGFEGSPVKRRAKYEF